MRSALEKEKKRVRFYRVGILLLAAILLVDQTGILTPKTERIEDLDLFDQPTYSERDIKILLNKYVTQYAGQLNYAEQELRICIQRLNSQLNPVTVSPS